MSHPAGVLRVDYCILWTNTPSLIKNTPLGSGIADRTQETPMGSNLVFPIKVVLGKRKDLQQAVVRHPVKQSSMPESPSSSVPPLPNGSLPARLFQNVLGSAPACPSPDRLWNCSDTPLKHPQNWAPPGLFAVRKVDPWS